MELIVEQEEVWTASLQDRPGALAEKLAGLADAGADLEFIIARRAHEKPGTGVVFVTPVRGDKEIRAATQAGFSVTTSLHSLRVEGQNQSGLAARLTQRLGAAGLNLRGFSAAVVGTGFVIHLAFESEKDVMRARAILQRAG